MNINPTLWATGGLAVIAAGWSQLKNTFSYLSSFLVVRASLQSGITYPMRVYLKQNWQVLPSGLLNYKSKYLRFKDRAHNVTVPFRVIGNKAVFRKGWKFVIFSIDNGQSTLMGIRGMVNFDNLVRDALLQGEERFVSEKTRDNESETRFQIHTVMGSEKGIFAQSLPQRAQGTRTADTSDSDISSEHTNIDLSVDLSFMYPKEMYTFSNDTDPFANLFYPPEVLKQVAQAQQWMGMGNWYTARGIPWRRGTLFYGPPGTGKTSLAKALAQKLKIPLYHFYLATLSDQEMIHEWQRMDTPCLALLEDFDTVFNLREPLTEHKSLTFECILNLLSGVDSTSGIFTVVTTNHIDRIDPALGVAQEGTTISTRPGRIDTALRLGYMDEGNRMLMAQQVLRDWPDEIEALVHCEAAQQVAAIQFQEMCIQRAFDRIGSELPFITPQKESA